MYNFLPLWYVKTYTFISNALFVLCFHAGSNKQIHVIVVTKWSHVLTIPMLFITTFLVHENGVTGPFDLTSTPAQTQEPYKIDGRPFQVAGSPDDLAA